MAYEFRSVVVQAVSPTVKGVFHISTSNLHAHVFWGERPSEKKSFQNFRILTIAAV